MIGYENVVDAMLFEARVAILDGEMLEVEPSQFSDCMMHVMEKLRQAEKDAARYRFIKQWSQSHSLNVYRKELWDEIVDREINNESRRIMKSSNGGDL